VVGALTLAACGKKGPPLAPIRVLPAPPQEVRLRQVGPEVVLTAAIPGARTDGSPLGAGAALRVLRMRAATLTPTAASHRTALRTFEKESKLIITLAGQALREAAPHGRLLLRDPEAVQQTAAPGQARFVYGLVLVDGEGKRSPLSATVGITVREPPPPPAGLKVDTAEGEVRLSWQPVRPEPAPRPSPMLKSESPPHIVKTYYNVYRRRAADASDLLRVAPINALPIDQPAYVDKEFHYGETVAYTVRAVVDPTPPWRESLSAPELEVTPQDVYPPAAPTGLAVAAEGGVLKLYWFPNSEPDLKGYRIYRREAGGRGEFSLLATIDAADSSYADASAVAGVKYDYCVSAVDGAATPNESRKSEARSETLPSDAVRPRAEDAP
jgi:hypothetical protein